MASGHHRGAPLVGAQTHGAQGADAVSWYPASRVLPRDPDDRGAVEGWPPAPAAGGSRGSRDRRCDPVPPLRAGVWQLVYWPCFDRRGAIAAGAGRAEYARVLFEEAGVRYEEVEDASFVRDFFWRRAEDLQGHPVLAPPAIHRDGFVLAQTAAIARYLARRLGLLPAGGAEAEARADQICETVHELVAEGRLAFHPDHSHRKPYHAQRAAAAPYIEAFERSRLPRLLAHFERLLAAGADEGPEGAEEVYLVGGRLSYVDLQLFVALRAARASFPGAGGLPARLAAFERQIAGRRRIADYLDSPRCRPFAGDSMM